MVSGHQAPAFTVASLATITAGRPSILPRPVTTPAAGRLAVVSVVGDQQADFEEERAGVEQRRDALARGHLAGAMLLVDARRAAAFAQAVFQLAKLFDQEAHVRLARGVHGYFSWEKSVGS